MSCVSVLTGSPSLPSRSSVEAALRGLLPLATVHEERAAMRVGFDGASVVVVASGGPVPNAEADTAAFLSPSAVNGRWRLGPHSAHLSLRLGGSLRVADGVLGRLSGTTRVGTKLEQLAVFTKVVAAVAKAAGGLGVHWAAAPVTHAPDFFFELAHETLPLPLWLGVSVTPEPGQRSTILSFGMGQLGLPELLLVCPSKALPDSLDFFYSALATVAERGVAPVEGERIPRSLLSRPSVRYGDSPVQPGQRVWQLEV